MKKVAILQSNYIPWKGYFDLMGSVDVFVIYDTVQYTKNDWRNRNRIIANGSVQWLTIPVKQESLGQKINETRISDPRWANKHWKTLKQNYGGCDQFAWCSEEIGELYAQMTDVKLLSEVNFAFIERIASLLELETEFRFADEFELSDDRQSRLIELCQILGCDTYVSGQSAKSYIEESGFRENGIALEWFDYGEYGEYSQRSETFHHQVSVLDMMFNMGKHSAAYLGKRRG